MKFYFCEGCGKRVTDQDLAAGTARDKKLRGVYCKQCGESVLTMERLPLSDDAAREILKEESKSQPGPGNRPLRNSRTTRVGSRHQSSASALPTPTASGRGGPAHPDTQHQNNTFTVAAAAGAFILVIITGVFLMSSGKRITPHAKKQSRKNEPVSQATEKSSSPTNPDSSEKNAPQTSKLRNQKPTAPMETKKRTAKSTAPHQSDAPQKPATLQGGRQGTDSLKKVKKSPARINPELQARWAAEQAYEDARVKLDGYLRALGKAGVDEDKTAAKAVSEAVTSDPLLQPLGSGLDGTRCVFEVLDRIANTHQMRLKSLATDGQVHRFTASGKVIKGTVRKVEGEKIFVQVKGSINGKPIEYGKTVLLKELTNEDRENILGTFTPQKADEWTFQALRNIHTGDLKAVEDAIAKAEKAEGHPLIPHLKQWLLHAKQIAELGESEYHAQRAWDRAERIFAAGDTQTAAKHYLDFQKQYGATKVFKNNEAMLRKRILEVIPKNRVYLADLKYEKVEMLAARNFFKIGAVSGWLYRGTTSKGKSIYMHSHPKAPSAITYILPNPFNVLKAKVGMRHRNGPKVWFSVWGDGKKLWESPQLTFGSGFKDLKVDITGVKVLTLKAHTSS